MKKIVFFVMCLLIMIAPSAFAKEEGMKKDGVRIQINGVDVISGSNYQASDSKVYVDVDRYTKMIGKTYEYDKEKHTIKIAGKEVAVSVRSGDLVAYIRDLAAATGAEKVSWFGDEELVYVLDLPEGVIQTPLVPGMGEHWFLPQDMPIGPIYGVYEGRLVFIEQMIAQKDFVDGTNHVNIDGMRGLPSPSVVHTDIEFQPKGHEGFEIPHFDIHHYFVTHEEHMKFGVDGMHTGAH